MKKSVCLLACVAVAVAVVAGLAACSSGNSANVYQITLDAGPHDVESCPTSAAEGETVVVRTAFVTDADLYVSVDGDQEFGEFTNQGYEFVMPDHDVTVRVWVVSNGLA